MRQGSTCLPREPARCSTYSRSISGFDTSNPKAYSYNNSAIPKSYGDNWTVSQTPSEHTSTNLNVPLDGLKALPTRLKTAHGYEQYKKVHASVEENKLRHATKTQTEHGTRSALPLGRPNPTIEVNVARSRCHPRRRPCPDALPAATPKLRRDTDCTEAIVRLIVFFSTKLVHTIWSQASVTPKSSRDFNGAGVLPLQVFIQETLRRSKTSYSTLQVALFYLILLRPHVKPCQSTQQQYTPGCRALQCGRRMFLTALILASKYLQDRNYSARAWSKISGLPVAEINENERHYLELIKYNLHMSKESFENWSRVVLNICKASGQGPNSGKPDSPPSSPDGLSFSEDGEQVGSSGWWLYHLSRLSPDMVKDSMATEEYLAGLATGAPFVASALSLDTPPASPEDLQEVLSEHNSPVVMSSGAVPVHTNFDAQAIVSSPTVAANIPTRPVPANLPTPQTTPRYDNAFNFSRRPSHTDLRCRSSLQAMVGIDKQAFSVANLETCPPPKPRRCGGRGTHALKESVTVDPSTAVWMSSPESSFSDSSSNVTRSRSSSVSSVSSLWSVPSQTVRQTDNKTTIPNRADSQPSCPGTQASGRANVGSYSFYHPVTNMHSTPAGARLGTSASSQNMKPTLQRFHTSHIELCKPTSDSSELSDSQIAQLLASLSSQSDEQIQERNDPAAISTSADQHQAHFKPETHKKHKRSRSSKGESILHEEVRHFLWNEQIQVCVEDDKKPTTYVETSDKQAQYPLQQWAHAKKPVPNALHNKRIALQHSSSSEQKHASELAADFLRHSVAVM